MTETPTANCKSSTTRHAFTRIRKIEKILVMPDGKELTIEGNIGRLDLAKYAAPKEAMWISRQHFSILEEDTVPFIQNEGSSNGTKLNGVEMKQLGKQQLKNGDEIIVGDAAKIIFRLKTP